MDRSLVTSFVPLILIPFTNRNVGAIALSQPQVLLIDLACTAFYSVLVLLIRAPYGMLTWLWTIAFFRNFTLVLLLPRKADALWILALLLVLHTGLFISLYSIIQSMHDAEYQNLHSSHFQVIVKRAKGEVKRISATSPKRIIRDVCSICMQSIMVRTRSNVSLDINRLHPRFNHGKSSDAGVFKVYEPPCKHGFHLDCISKWMKVSVQNTKCPNCMQTITELHHELRTEN